MKTLKYTLFTLLSCIPLYVYSVNADKVVDSSTLTTKTSDNVMLYGEEYSTGRNADAPLILLFHQGGSNGRGEYSSIASWLNKHGFRAIAWDQRSGGATYGSENRTVQHLPENTANGYCDAAADLQAALDFVVKNELAKRVVVWGSSYSGALVFQLAAKNPDLVSGVISFSPASGGPLVECRARLWASEIKAPMFVLRPSTEMERESSLEQRDILQRAGVQFEVVEQGIHGSSMLVDERTGQNMRDARNTVLKWLKEVSVRHD
jgi:pimeloyl-ACP methyl ester carboxylesterase